MTTEKEMPAPLHSECNHGPKTTHEVASASSHTPTPWTIYQCSFAKKEDPTSACGFNEHGLDMSYDECHHPISLANAAYIVKCVNAHEELLMQLKRLYVLAGPRYEDKAVEQAIAKAEGK